MRFKESFSSWWRSGAARLCVSSKVLMGGMLLINKLSPELRRSDADDPEIRRWLSWELLEELEIRRVSPWELLEELEIRRESPWEEWVAGGGSVWEEVLPCFSLTSPSLLRALSAPSSLVWDWEDGWDLRVFLPFFPAGGGGGSLRITSLSLSLEGGSKIDWTSTSSRELALLSLTFPCSTSESLDDTCMSNGMSDWAGLQGYSRESLEDEWLGDEGLFSFCVRSWFSSCEVNTVSSAPSPTPPDVSSWSWERLFVLWPGEFTLGAERACLSGAGWRIRVFRTFLSPEIRRRDWLSPGSRRTSAEFTAETTRGGLPILRCLDDFLVFSSRESPPLPRFFCWVFFVFFSLASSIEISILFRELAKWNGQRSKL